MAQAVESKDSSGKVPDSSVDKKPAPQKSTHLHLVNEKTDPNIRVGERLRTARLEKNLGIEDIARQLKFRREYIEAIESMQTSRLPKGFVNPYIRDYARHLGLDPKSCVEDFNKQCGALSQADEIVPKATKPENNGSGLKLMATLAATALIAAGAWFGYTMITDEEASQSAVAAATSPYIAATPQVNGAKTPVTLTATPDLAAGKVNLEIRAVHRAWIEIRGADGTLFIDRQFSAGETYDLRVGAGWTLTTQNAGAFEWLVDGRAIAAVGETDQALYTLGIDGVAKALASADEAG